MIKDGVVFDYTQFPVAEPGGNAAPVSNIPWVQVSQKNEISRDQILLVLTFYKRREKESSVFFRDRTRKKLVN
jgi:hypothetical protein